MNEKLNELVYSGVEITFYDGYVFRGILFRNVDIKQDKDFFALAWYNKKGVLETRFTFNVEQVMQVERYNITKNNGGQVI